MGKSIFKVFSSLAVSLVVAHATMKLTSFNVVDSFSDLNIDFMSAKNLQDEDPRYAQG